MPVLGDTIDFQQTKEHYYKVHTSLNPSKIVPAGPDLSGWLTPHHREELGGRPFGDGTPPGPPPPEEARGGMGYSGQELTLPEQAAGGVTRARPACCDASVW